MRVTKNRAGQFVIEDEPRWFDGKVAKEMLAQMHARDASPKDDTREKFLAECARVYSSAKRSG